MIRVLAACAALILPAVVQARCIPAADLRSGALTGTFLVDQGAAQTMGAPMAGGSDELVVQSSGGGLTLVIEGRRIALQRLPDTAAPWDWETSPGVAVTATDAGIVMGCDINAMARFQGTADGATWRVMAPATDALLVMWILPDPPSSGLFLVTR